MFWGLPGICIFGRLVYRRQVPDMDYSPIHSFVQQPFFELLRTQSITSCKNVYICFDDSNKYSVTNILYVS